MSLYTLFKEGTGRPDLTDAEIDVFLDNGNLFIEENLEYGAEDWDSTLAPMAVVLSAMYQYELLYRNREAAIEHLEGLKIALQSHNFSFIEDSSRLITRMEG